MNFRSILLIAFVLAVVAYLYLVLMLTMLPASIIYGKTQGERPYGELLQQFIVHEVAMATCGAAVVVYAITLFRDRRDWRPFAVLLIGVPLALGVYEVFGL